MSVMIINFWCVHRVKRQLLHAASVHVVEVQHCITVVVAIFFHDNGRMAVPKMVDHISAVL